MLIVANMLHAKQMEEKQLAYVTWDTHLTRKILLQDVKVCIVFHAVLNFSQNSFLRQLKCLALPSAKVEKVCNTSSNYSLFQ